MAGVAGARLTSSTGRRGPTEPRWVRALLIAVALGYLLLLLALPLVVVFTEALSKGIAAYV